MKLAFLMKLRFRSDAHIVKDEGINVRSFFDALFEIAETMAAIGLYSQ